ncbi:M3 family oligoendopeptidase [bacterium]|nr:M3 family oligoendopeptidase [bacterium]
MKADHTEAVQWDLEQILPLKEFDALYAEIESEIPKYTAWQKKLKPDMATEQFVEHVEWSTRVSEKFTRLVDRVALWETTDIKDGEPARLKARAQDLGVQIAEVTRPIGMWLKGKEVEGMEVLDDKNATRLFAALPDYEYSLQHSRRMAKFTLSLEAESIITHKDTTGTSVLTDLRDAIEADFEYSLKLADKKQIYKTTSELMRHVYAADADEREVAYRALYVPYEREKQKFFKVYQAVVKDWAYEAALRGYDSTISMRNAGNHIPDTAIETLLQVCEDESKVFQDFFRWKQQQLGLKQIRRFDIYAPVGESQHEFSYAEAVDLTLKSFMDFSPDFAVKAQRIIDEQHIDSHPNPNKRGGAFCATVTPSMAPYVLLNYAGKARDVSTLAHELGHGVHSLYASHLPIGVQHANLPLAETASTFGEMLLFENMLDALDDPAERQAMIAEKIADSYATICRQTYFVKFELEAHKVIPEGAGVEDLEKLWLDTLHAQFGDSVAVDDVFRHEWAYIPHIVHTPFYCYAYSFGELLSLSLYARYKQEGRSFVPKIENILKVGGSRDPHKVLMEVGVDMASADFWRGGFAIIKTWVKGLQ